MDDTQRVNEDEAASVPAAQQARSVEEAQGRLTEATPGPDPSLPVPIETPDPSATAAGGATHVEDRVVERARETAVRLKPVAIAAEEMTARALDLSAKGLAKAAAYLEQRRQARRAQTPAAPESEVTGPEP